MPYTRNDEIYASEIKDKKCNSNQGVYCIGGKIRTYKEYITYMMDAKEMTEKGLPFTRIELPDGIEIERFDKPKDSVVIAKRHDLHMVRCDSLETARKLRSEIIKSLELLNFYIDQVEETGRIRYVR